MAPSSVSPLLGFTPRAASHNSGSGAGLDRQVLKVLSSPPLLRSNFPSLEPTLVFCNLCYCPGPSITVLCLIIIVTQGALRRESVASAEIVRLSARLQEMEGLVQAKDKDTQRLNMIIRLREGKIKRLEGRGGEGQDVTAAARELREELTLWKEKAEHHPEVVSLSSCCCCFSCCCCC